MRILRFVFRRDVIKNQIYLKFFLKFPNSIDNFKDIQVNLT